MRYNGDDTRVEVKIGTATPRRFVYDEDGRLIGEYGATVATINAEHVWLTPEVAEGGYEPLALVGPTTTSWVHGDHLGTPVMITSSAGVRVNDMQATPFGNRYRTAANSPKTAIAFPGQIIDIADRHYNMHRDYDPTLGRYLQADPIGLEGGDNVYAYVGGNPVNRTDPSGLIAPIVIAGVCAGGGCEVAGAAILGALWYLTHPITLPDKPRPLPLPDTKPDCPPDDNGDPQCHKASKWELRQAGIYDEHQYKIEHDARPPSRFDICKCKDGSIRIAPVGQCGRTRNFWS